MMKNKNNIESLDDMFHADSDINELKEILISIPKVSNRKVIISGNVVETFEFKYPIKYHKNPKDLFKKRFGETEEEYRLRTLRELTKETPNNTVLITKKGEDQKPRTVSEKSIYRTKQNVRRIIFANAWKYSNKQEELYTPQFITFTFKENVNDLKEANYLFNKYIKRLNYKLIKELERNVCYISVPEFQKRGAVHYHVIFFNLPLIDTQEEFKTGIFAETWKHGFIKVKHIKEAKGVSAYLTKYLTKDLIDARFSSKKKYFCSRNIKRPYPIHDMERAQEVINNISIFEKDYKSDYKTPGGNEVLYSLYHLSDEEIKKLGIAT